MLQFVLSRIFNIYASTADEAPWSELDDTRGLDFCCVIYKCYCNKWHIEEV
jgi:hypothetical protein